MVTAIPGPGRWVQIQRHLRTAAPYLLLGVLVVAVWWAGPWLLPLAAFAIACWRSPDLDHVRFAIELIATALVLVLTATAVLIHCMKQVTEP